MRTRLGKVSLQRRGHVHVRALGFRYLFPPFYRKNLSPNAAMFSSFLYLRASAQERPHTLGDAHWPLAYLTLNGL